jgi:hypothetical protein
LKKTNRAAHILIFLLSLLSSSIPLARASCLGDKFKASHDTHENLLYTQQVTDLGRTQGPLAVVVSQTMDGYEQARRKEKLKDLNLPDAVYKLHEEALKQAGLTVDVREMNHARMFWRQQPGLFTHLLIYRSDARGADVSDVKYFDGNAASAPNGVGNVTIQDAQQMVESMENQLYRQYRAQGGFGEKEEGEYRQQGIERANYTTHFMSYTDSIKTGLRPSNVVEALAPTDATTLTADKKVGHLQLQVSDTLANPLNSESNRSQSSEPNTLGRKENERWGDLGRGLNLLEQDLSDATKAHLKLADLSRPDRFSALVQDAVGWGIHYAKLDKLVFQVNDTVLAKMKAILGPENVTHVKTYEGSKEKGEWYKNLNTVVLTRAQMERAEEHMFAREMTARIEGTIERFNEAKALWNTDDFYVTLQPSVLNQEVFNRLLPRSLIPKARASRSHQLNLSMGPDLQPLREAIALLKHYL